MRSRKEEGIDYLGIRDKNEEFIPPPTFSFLLE